MAHDTDAFRTRYRAGISPRYSGPLHALWVACFGLTLLAWALARLDDVQPLEWLMLPLTLVLGNVGEYQIHHSFFTPGHMLWDSTRDWRVVLFPGWLIVVVAALIGLPGLLALDALVSANAGALWMAGIIATYLIYELVHFSDHLPEGHWLHRVVPGLGTMAALHRIHHDRHRMTEVNFNLTFPLTDWLLGTLARR